PEEIDGLAMSYTYGGPHPHDMAKSLGISPKKAWINGHIMAGPLPAAAGEILKGENRIIALIFCVASRSTGRKFGGMTFAGGMGGPASYYYFHPWGWSSQAAHWALMATRYFNRFGKGEEELGLVAQTVRKHAAMNPNAIMQQPFTIEDYMASRYIVKPLHLLDICLVNDGAVCLIISEAARARDCAGPAVDIAGWGEAYVRNNKMRTMIEDRLRPQMQEAGSQAFAMAGLSIDDVGHLEGYDAGSIHLVNHVEGFGFCKVGEGLDFCADGQMTLGGRIPTNTAGGNLSHAYMQGWSQCVEAVRQLRQECGARQIRGLEVSLTCLTQTDASHPILFQKGG
ncbi:MAG: thiolase family protein, partial [Novosphingobium sp.]|nr:thiolase family protein [Novosphingobium sp.]